MILINPLINVLYYKTYHIETSQSILTAYQLTGPHMQTSLYQDGSMNRLYKLHFLKHENF